MLAILVESGMLYCVLGVRMDEPPAVRALNISQMPLLITSLIRLPAFGTVGDVYAPISMQVAVRSILIGLLTEGTNTRTPKGIYPTIVIVLVGLERTLNDTTFWPGSNTGYFDQEQHGETAQAHQSQANVTRSCVSRIQFAHDGISSVDDCELAASDVKEKPLKPDAR